MELSVYFTIETAKARLVKCEERSRRVNTSAAAGPSGQHRGRGGDDAIAAFAGGRRSCEGDEVRFELTAYERRQQRFARREIVLKVAYGYVAALRDFSEDESIQAACDEQGPRRRQDCLASHRAFVVPGSGGHA